MFSAGIEFCRPVPDDSSLFANVPVGHTVKVDGILYVRESEWLPFLVYIRNQLVSG